MIVVCGAMVISGVGEEVGSLQHRMADGDGRWIEHL